MLKATKVRIYPTDEQVIQLSKDFGATRWLWNQALAVMSQTYKETGKGVSAYRKFGSKASPFWGDFDKPVLKYFM